MALQALLLQLVLLAACMYQLAHRHCQVLALAQMQEVLL
jgi:hypothetical protein